MSRLVLVLALVVCSVLVSAQPVNDNCAEAIKLLAGTPVHGTNVRSTDDVGGNVLSPCGGFSEGANVWYYFNSGTATSVDLTLCGGTDYDAFIFLYSGESCGSLLCATFDDDSCVFAGPSKIINYPIEPGHRYYVAVSGYSGATGSFTLRASFAGGIGGDPHIYTFAGDKIDLDTFEDGKNYLLYGFGTHFQIAIQTEGPKDASYITAVGVAMGSHQLRARFANNVPQLTLDGHVLPFGFAATTIFGELEVYVPEKEELTGGLSELSDYVTIGVRVANLFEIVGGYQPVTGGFWNVQVHKADEHDYGLLVAAKGTKVDTHFVSRFEIPSLA